MARFSNIIDAKAFATGKVTAEEALKFDCLQLHEFENEEVPSDEALSVHDFHDVYKFGGPKFNFRLGAVSRSEIYR